MRRRSAEGPAKLVDTKGYSTSMMISTLKKLDGVQTLNRGASGAIAIPAHRMAQRVFGEGVWGAQSY